MSKVNISISDWINIGNHLYKNDPDFSNKIRFHSLSKSAQDETLSEGLLKEAKWYNPLSWMGGEEYDPIDFKSMQWDMQSQDNLIRLNNFLNQNPNLIKLVPRLSEVQGDISQAVQQAQGQRAMMDQYFARREKEDIAARKEKYMADQKAKPKRMSPQQQNIINDITGKQQTPTQQTPTQQTPTQQTPTQQTPTQQIPEGYETVTRRDKSFSRKIPQRNSTKQQVMNRVNNPLGPWGDIANKAQTANWDRTHLNEEGVPRSIARPNRGMSTKPTQKFAPKPNPRGSTIQRPPQSYYA